MRKRKYYLFGALVVTAVLFFLLGMGSNPGKGKADVATPVQTIVIKDEIGFSTAISEVAEALIDAVVHINVTGTVVQRGPDFGFPFGNDPFFRYFFGPPQQQEYEVPVQALGSGVIISKEGYIITNNHVVQNADTIEVVLNNGTKHEAKLIGTDPRTDLAVVKIKPTQEMKYARFGDSDQCKVGAWVIAIGSPRGLDSTVTAGIISAKNRTNIGVLGPTGYEDFIQTDAAINPGNSGGPLINLKGEVIGINALIVSASAGSEGLGFAIPSNMAKEISDSLIKHGKVVRGYLGVNIQDITPEMSKSLKLDKNFKGVIIADVVASGPAEQGGIEQGDIVIRYDGKRIETVAELRNSVAATDPGITVKITVLRDKKEREFSIRIGELEKAEEEARARSGSIILGLKVETVDTDTAKRLGLKKATGVIIIEVESGSAADRAGLQKGDIIFRVGNTPVDDPAQFNELIAQSSQEGRVMLLVRDAGSGRVGYLVVPLQ
ncbi:MAG: Do family serine endopeptidase [Spirochaetota bacterium]|nr:MAG: Do family serine endopeptidase [Spirochaetota bacterium]